MVWMVWCRAGRTCLGDAQDGGDGVDGEDEVGELDAEEAHEERRGEALAVLLLGVVGAWVESGVCVGGG